MRIFTFVGIAACIAAPAAILGAMLKPEVHVQPKAPTPSVAVALPVSAPEAPQLRPAPLPVQVTAPSEPWMVASTRGCALIGPLGYDTPQAFIAAATRDGMQLQVLYSDSHRIALTDATNARAPVVFFARGRAACEQVIEMGADLLPLY